MIKILNGIVIYYIIIDFGVLWFCDTFVLFCFSLEFIACIDVIFRVVGIDSVGGSWSHHKLIIIMHRALNNCLYHMEICHSFAKNMYLSFYFDRNKSHWTFDCCIILLFYITLTLWVYIRPWRRQFLIQQLNNNAVAVEFQASYMEWR